MNHRLALVALATVVASASCSGIPTTSTSSKPPEPVVVTPPPGKTPVMGESWRIEIDLPSPPNVSPLETVIVAWIFVRSDGARMGIGCSTPHAIRDVSMTPSTPVVWWALSKGYSVDLEFLIGTMARDPTVWCPFFPNDMFEIVREVAVMPPIQYPLGWKW